ncbi:FKBP-type peptidyl-prolyl cis-trans isomerase [Isoptericola jiangsuensis]|uniref:FKBP-type peptidyl-prolyl cis-trans isomerase n=1 Tax=Isoptericola jiangsuensis TaxID=548579 RepID=UPI003AADC169
MIEGFPVKIRHSAGAAALLAAALTLTACSDGGEAPSEDASASASAEASDSATTAPEPTEEDIAALESVEVEGEPGEEPTLTFSDVSVSVPTTRVVTEGDGDELTEGKLVTIQYAAYDSAGERQGSTWESNAPESFSLGAEGYDLLNGPLTGQKVGTRILLASPTVDAEQNPTTVVNVVEVTDVAEARAIGEPVEPAEGLPTVTLAEDGAPSVDIPEGYEAPDELVAQTLIKGDGAEVTADQSVTAQYTGWTLDGEVFDSSWERGTPAQFSLQQVIPGWTDGLSGQTVGSQVLLVIPADQAYGANPPEGSSIEPDSPLIFVVDILSAS